MNKYYREIRDYLDTIPVIDSHEHLPVFDNSIEERNTDFISEYLKNYIAEDLVNAGITIEEGYKVLNPSLPLKERWIILEPYWERCRFTGYGQVLDKTVKGLYKVDGIYSKNIDDIDYSFKEMTKSNRYEIILKDKCNIEVSFVDKGLLFEFLNDNPVDDKYFIPVYNIDRLVQVRGAEMISQLEQITGIRVNSFENYLKSCDRILDIIKDKGLSKVFKLGLAYTRSLKFENVTREAAEREFNKILPIPSGMLQRGHEHIYKMNKEFQDFMIHYLLNKLDEHNMVLQIHTGLQASTGNVISNSNPELLENVFLQYPNIKFDIFHIGYPYHHQLTALAKQFPNVYIDMCWAHIISPKTCVDMLLEWLEVLPLNKVLAFGGDFGYIDAVYGHLHIAKNNVAKALSIKVEEGLFDIEQAKKTGKMLFYDNPKHVLLNN